MGVDLSRLLLALPYASATETLARNDQQARYDDEASRRQAQSLNQQIMQQRLLQDAQDQPLHTRLIQSEIDRNARDASLRDPHDDTVNPQDANAYRIRYPELAGLSDAEAIRQGRIADTQGRIGQRQTTVNANRPRGGRTGSGITPAQRAQQQARLNAGVVAGQLREVAPQLQAAELNLEGAGNAADSARAQGAITGLQHRADSLRTVRDNLAAQAQGGQPAAGGATSKIPVTQDEYTTLAQQNGADFASRHYVVQP